MIYHLKIRLISRKDTCIWLCKKKQAMHCNIKKKQEKKRKRKTTMSKDESQKVRWNKPGGEKQVPYDLNYKWNLVNKINERKNWTRDTETWNSLIALGGEEGRENGEWRWKD